MSSNNAAVRVFLRRETLWKQVPRSWGTRANSGCFECAYRNSDRDGG